MCSYVLLDGNYDFNPASPVAVATGVTGDNAWSETWVYTTLTTQPSLSTASNYGVMLTTGAVDASNYAAHIYEDSDKTANMWLAGWDSTGDYSGITDRDISAKVFYYD